MNREELTGLLAELAEADLQEGKDLYDHPCNVAIRAINQAFDDIEVLRRACKYKEAAKTKRATMLIELYYDPSW